MEPPHNWDGIGNDVAGDDELDNILSILDFPMESLEAEGFGGDWDATKSDYLGPIPSDVLMGPALVAEVKTEVQHPVLFPLPFSPPMSSNKVDVPKQNVPLYQFSDSSSSSIPRQNNKCTEVSEQGVFQSQSPVSVLESSVSSLASKTASLTKTQINKRARSRRSRPLVNPWLLISPPIVSTLGSRKARKANATRKKPSRPVPQLPKVAVEIKIGGAVKKCAHCEVTKTPQWREGPLGPKTLCNACGVRYRSGRLFPEYRPAASPTFVPAVHSNSHKKVLEMRNKVAGNEVQVKDEIIDSIQ